MSTLTSLARVEAVHRGTAQPICTVRHVHVSQRPLVVIPLALAGEACAPMAAMVGGDLDAPRLLVVPQPRDRTRRFAFAAELADVVIPYIEGYFAAEETAAGGRGDPMGAQGFIVLLFSIAVGFYVMSGYYAPEPDDSRLASYYDDPTKVGIILSLIWGIIGMFIGVWVAALLAWPDLTFDAAWASFGRLRPVHTSGVIFGFGGNALIATSFHVLQRTTRAPAAVGHGEAALRQRPGRRRVAARRGGAGQGDVVAQLPDHHDDRQNGGQDRQHRDRRHAGAGAGGHGTLAGRTLGRGGRLAR